MAKISKEEYEILKDLGEQWEWMARDENGQLYKYMDKPRKINDFNWNDPAETWLPMNDDNFKFIQCSDSDPYSIAELIEEYENEETEVKKDLNWFKEKLEVLKKIDRRMWEESEPNSKNQSHFNGSLATIDKALDFLSQLDEPEVLSQEWIESNTSPVDDEGRLYVWESDLQNLLVPKQEDADQAYKGGYEKGKQYTFYKDCLEGLADKESINPEGGPEVDQHKELLDELNDLYARKNQDYGNSFDESLDEDGLLVLKIRLGDKYKRFSTLINQKNEVVDESMRDTLIDLANYALMGVMWMDKNGEEEDEHNNYH